MLINFYYVNSHEQELFYKFVCNITNKLEKKLLSMTVLIGDQECNSDSLECKVFSIYKDEIPYWSLELRTYTVILLTQIC